MSAGPLFRSRARPGFDPRIESDPVRVFARKLVREIDVEFASREGSLQTREGVVRVRPGDAVITGTAGERWRVSPAHFSAKYSPVGSVRPGEAGHYASKPVTVIAVRMTEAFQVLLADGESQLSGRAGDWLVDYGDGSLGIVSPGIFATTYEITGR